MHTVDTLLGMVATEAAEACAPGLPLVFEPEVFWIREINRVIHEPMRLAITLTLASQAAATFVELRELLMTSDGNLSIHCRRLEEAGYVAVEKAFVGKVPRTSYRLTALGRDALDEYADDMRRLLHGTGGAQ